MVEMSVIRSFNPGLYSGYHGVGDLRGSLAETDGHLPEVV
jgi:hypothetical protein